jgi:hypothetical protein
MNDNKEPDEDLNELFQTDEINSDILEIISQFYDNDEFLETKTDIPRNLITNFAKLRILNELIKDFDDELSLNFENMILHYYYLRISKDRQGRKEVFDTIKFLNGESTDKKENSFISRFFRR